VQDFISAARRTRDLWFGSYVLSEISKAAALKIGAARLIFPNRADAENPEGHVANVILAMLPEGEDPGGIAGRAEIAAQKSWEHFAEQAFQAAAGYILEDRARRQMLDVIEFYWASAPLATEQDYRDTRRRVMRLLAGRKMCRDFKVWHGERVPKSSLDGARETVLRKPETEDEVRRRNEQLRLNTKEQLDAVGLVKRLATGKQQYPSVSRIAADPWLRGIVASDGKPLTRLLAECRNIGSVLTQINTERFPQFREFPFEGTAVYLTRHKELWKDSTRTEEDFRDLKRAVKALERDFGAPDPYLAILVADGDKMGKTISGIAKADDHREFSRDLGTFAREAGQMIVEHKGCLVYSGGDDVLAFLPVDRCLECARKLHDRFGELLKPHRRPGIEPTLSVGIAIGHSMEPLEDLLHFAREAEKAAKGKDRNGLAVHLHPRAGAPVLVRGGWKSGIDEDLESLARMHLAEQIPDKAGYDLRELSRLYKGWPVEDAAAIPQDVTRLLKRKRIREPEESWKAQIGSMQDATSVRFTADKIIIARKLATAKRQASPRKPAVPKEAA
jgi:CRISPR-associated protein Cmr2